MAEQMAILEVSELSIGYSDTSGEKRAVYQPLSLSAQNAELIALIGRNGIGKSTLLRSLAGLQKCIHGEVWLLGRKLASYPRKELASLVSFVAAEPVRVTNMKVFDLVALGRFPYTNWIGGLSKEDKRKILEALDLVGLSGFTWRKLDQLSDGERQRAMIARSLAQDTQLIIFDEPTAFIDLPSKYEVIILLRSLARDKGRTIIFSTHDLASAMNLSDKCWLMLPSGFKSGAPEDLAMENAYDGLFEHTNLTFDSKTGNVQIINTSEQLQKVYVSGDGDLYWIKKALERFGFYVSNEASNSYPSLHVESINGNLQLHWAYKEQNALFFSIYELDRFLKFNQSYE